VQVFLPCKFSTRVEVEHYFIQENVTLRVDSRLCSPVLNSISESSSLAGRYWAQLKLTVLLGPVAASIATVSYRFHVSRRAFVEVAWQPSNDYFGGIVIPEKIDSQAITLIAIRTLFQMQIECAPVFEVRVLL
jgi:hypothetical protein